jgi:hypothetical protein
MTFGEVLFAGVLTAWFIPPPWRFRVSALLIVFAVGAGLGG